MLRTKDHSRIHEVMYCSAEEKPVERSELVKGYEYQKGRYVVVTPEEIKAVTPPTSKVMEILQFVKGDEIDPIFFESSYYVAPETTGEKAYALLLEALRQSKFDGLAKVTMHGREHIVILRPAERGIMLHTMYYLDEIRDVAEFKSHKDLVNDKELKLARVLVESMVDKFKPEQYKDTFRGNLKKLIEAKAKGKEIKPVPEPQVSKVVDIMEALQRSLEAKKPAQRERATTTKASRRKRLRMNSGRAVKPIDFIVLSELENQITKIAEHSDIFGTYLLSEDVRAHSALQLAVRKHCLISNSVRNPFQPTFTIDGTPNCTQSVALAVWPPQSQLPPEVARTAPR